MQERNIEDYSTRYVQSGFEKYQVQYRRRKVLEIIEAYAPKNILEVGCGTESLAKYYSAFSSFTIVEPAASFCAGARETFSKDSRVQIVQDCLENVSEILQKTHFDAVIVSGLLHEVGQPEVLLQHASTVGKHARLIHFNVPNANSLHIAWAMASGLIDNKLALSPRAVALQQHTRFDRDILDGMLVANGFTVIEQGDYFVKPFNHAKMELCMKHGILDTSLLDGLYSLSAIMPGFGSEIYANCVVDANASHSV